MHVDQQGEVTFTFVSDLGEVVNDLKYDRGYSSSGGSGKGDGDGDGDGNRSQGAGKLAIKTISQISNVQIVDHNGSVRGEDDKRRNLDVAAEDTWGVLTYETEDSNTLYVRMFTIKASKSTPISNINLEDKGFNERKMV